MAMYKKYLSAEEINRLDHEDLSAIKHAENALSQYFLALVGVSFLTITNLIGLIIFGGKVLLFTLIMFILSDFLIWLLFIFSYQIYRKGLEEFRK